MNNISIKFDFNKHDYERYLHIFSSLNPSFKRGLFGMKLKFYSAIIIFGIGLYIYSQDRIVLVSTFITVLLSLILMPIYEKKIFKTNFIRIAERDFDKEKIKYKTFTRDGIESNIYFSEEEIVTEKSSYHYHDIRAVVYDAEYYFFQNKILGDSIILPRKLIDGIKGAKETIEKKFLYEWVEVK